MGPAATADTPEVWRDHAETASATAWALVATICVLTLICGVLCRCTSFCRKHVWGTIPARSTQPLLVIKLFYNWQVATCPLMAMPYEANVLVTSYAPRVKSIRPGFLYATLEIKYDSDLQVSVEGCSISIPLPETARVPLRNRLMLWGHGGAVKS